MSPDLPGHDQLDALLNRTFGAAQLSDGQRERHLQRIARLTAQRRWTGSRNGLTELVAIAAIGLLTLAGVAVWQLLLKPETPAADDASGALFAIRDGWIVEIDTESGEIQREFAQVTGAANCSFLIASPDGELLAAGNSVGSEHQGGISVYSIADGQLVQDIPVPNLLQPLGTCRGIAFSADSRKLFVFQYEIPPDGTGDDARYWLGTYDLDSRTWQPKVEIAGCRGGRMQPLAIDRLLVHCGAIYEIDPATGEILRMFGWDIDGAVFLVRDGALYEVAITQTVLSQDLDAAPDSRRFLRGAPLDITERVVSGLPIGLDRSGRYLYVPVQLIESDYVPDAEITVIDLELDEAARVITPSRPFHDIAYATDGRTAFIATSDDLGSWDGLTRIDLETGAERELLAGHLGNLVFIPDER